MAGVIKLSTSHELGWITGALLALSLMALSGALISLTYGAYHIQLALFEYGKFIIRLRYEMEDDLQQAASKIDDDKKMLEFKNEVVQKVRTNMISIADKLPFERHLSCVKIGVFLFITGTILSGVFLLSIR